MDVRRWMRFAAGGIANTAVTYVAYRVLLTFLPYLWAYSAAYAIGIVVAYLVNAALVFRVPLSLKRFLAYPLIYVVQYFIAAALLATCVEYVGLAESLAPLVVIAAMVPISYLLNRTALARSHGSEPPDSAP